MGTNYYALTDPCDKCGRSNERLHIGKSSAAWCFSLHVGDFTIGDEEIQVSDLSDWRTIFERPGTRIENEYGEIVTRDGMLDEIMTRSWHAAVWLTHEPHAGTFYAENHAEPGPNGLLRHRIDGRHCIAHGSGTWDLCVGEFS